MEAKKTYNACIYLRLSKNEEKCGDSSGIESQKMLLEEYVAKRANWRLCGMYMDYGFSGTNFNRPAFQKMLSDAKGGTIHIIVIKDLSRLGRDHIETGNYIENVFPSYGVRIVSVNDGFDSYKEYDGITAVALKNLMNEAYALDISQKTITALEAKKRAGQFIGNYASYGYKKSASNKNMVVIDEETARTVRKIYKWRIEGGGVKEITERLNAMDIPSPSRYRFEKGIISNERIGKCLWNTATVGRILKNPMYIGHMTYGGKRTGSSRIYAVIENTHEPIIEKSVFEKVQKGFENEKINRSEYYE